jgi:hypothetical protein
LILIECPDVVDNYKDGDEIKLNIDEGKIFVAGKEFSFPVLPKEIIDIRNAGGLLAYTRNKLKEEQNS